MIKIIFFIKSRQQSDDFLQKYNYKKLLCLIIKFPSNTAIRARNTSACMSHDRDDAEDFPLPRPGKGFIRKGLK